MLANYARIFRNRPFRLFWSGFTFSTLGDDMTRVALTWLVYDSTRSAEALGWLMVCYTGPVVMGGLLAGTLLDRFDRRAVMIADSLVRGLAVLAIPILHAAGQLALWHIYTVAAAYGLLMMISLAGSPALVPSLVEGDQLSTANALETLGYMIGSILGPALAGFLIPRLGAANIMIVDAISYLIFALCLSRITFPRAEGTPSPAARSHYTLGHAVRLLFSNRVLFSTTFMFMSANIGIGLVGVWLPIYAHDTFNGDPQVYGALLALLALSEVIGALMAGAALPLALGTLICLGQTLAGGMLLLALWGGEVWMVALALGLHGFFRAPLTSWAQTLRMAVIPDALRGRAFALLRMLMMSGNPIGGGLAGAILPAFGLTTAVIVSAAMVGGPGLLGFQVRALREAGAPREAVRAVEER